MDRRRVALGLSAVVSVIAVVLAVLPGHAALPIYALMFLDGGLSFPLYGVFLSLAADRMRGDEFVAASSNVLLLNGAGSAIGPVLVAWLMEAVDARAYLLFVAAIHVIVCAMVAASLLRTGGGKVAPVRHHVNAMPQGSAVAAGMAGRVAGEP
jgi:fucose permease